MNGPAADSPPAVSHGDLSDDPGVQAAGRHRLVFYNALNAYPEVRERDSEGEAWEWLERLAEHWRRGAELTGLHFLGDDFLPDALGLLGALESSLALLGTGDPRRAELALTADEIVAGMIRVGPGLWPDWDRILNDMWRFREHVAGRPDTDRPDGWPPVPKPVRHPRRTRRAAGPLATDAGEALASVTKLYPRLDPDGRRLTGGERQEVLENIRAIAVAGLRMYRESGLFCPGDWDAWGIELGMLSSLLRSLALAVSDDPERRGLAMSLDHVRQYLFMSTHRVANRTSWFEAAEALRAFVAEQQA
jgi:hypothetical protein